MNFVVISLLTRKLFVKITKISENWKIINNRTNYNNHLHHNNMKQLDTNKEKLNILTDRMFPDNNNPNN